MAAHGRVDPDRDVHVLQGLEVAVERLAHAVQLLELEPARRLPAISITAGDGLRVVRGELRVEEVAAVEQALGAGEIGDVGRDLAGEDGIVGEPQLLRPLHLGVPVRALDQTDQDLARGPRASSASQSITCTARFW